MECVIKMDFSTLTPIQLHDVNTYIASVLVMFYIYMNIVFLIIGHLIVRKSHSKIWLIWFFGPFLACGFGLIFVIFFPNTIQSVLNFIIK